MSKIQNINPNKLCVAEMVENIKSDMNFKEALFIAIRPDGDVVLHCSSMTYSQLCFLKCTLDVFVDATLKRG